MAETKEEQAKRNWLEIQDRLAPGEDPIDRMLSDMAGAETGWHRVRNESGVALVLPDVPVFPSGSKEARAAEDAWEQRSLARQGVGWCSTSEVGAKIAKWSASWPGSIQTRFVMPPGGG